MSAMDAVARHVIFGATADSDAKRAEHACLALRNIGGCGVEERLFAVRAWCVLAACTYASVA